MTASRLLPLALLATLAFAAGCTSGITPTCPAADATAGDDGGQTPCSYPPVGDASFETGDDSAISEAGDDSAPSEAGPGEAGGSDASDGGSSEAGGDSGGSDAADAAD